MPDPVPLPRPDPAGAEAAPAAPEATTLRLQDAAWLQAPGQAAVRLERKQAALLAWLHLAGPSPRGKLAGLLWPEASASGARSNLRQCISRLRRLAAGVLAEAVDTLSLAPSLIVAPRAPAAPAWLNAYDYADCEDFARWLETQVEAERSRQSATLMSAIRGALQAGDLAHAQAEADALLALDRESEDSYRALMEVAYLRGDFAAAVAVWDRCRDMLRELYGVTPSTATQALGATILAASRAGEKRVVAPAPAIPLSVLRPPRLIGRALPLQALTRAWHSGLTVCVSGDAGIGKSRLLAEFTATLGAVVSIAARPGDAVAPYASMTRLVTAAIDRFRPPLDGGDARWTARLLPGIAYLVAGASPQPLQTDRERELALRGLHGLLAACTAKGAAAFVLDDLQFADRATLEALDTLIGELPVDIGMGTDTGLVTGTAPGPRFALGSRVDDAAAPSMALLESLAATRGFLRIELAPLADADVTALLESLALPAERVATLAHRLFAQVGGNPAFLLESLKLLLSLAEVDGGHDVDAARGATGAIPIPPGIEAIIQRRIALLGAPARHIAQLAAIAGGAFGVEMAAAALACPVFALTEPLRELERRQVLVGRQFVHDLVANEAKRSIPASVAEFMHRFVADYLEAHDGEPAVVAAHWSACGEWRRAGASHVLAAARALAAMRPREQAENLDAAIAGFERAGADDALFDAIVQRLEIMEVADRTVVRAGLNARLGSLARSEEQQLRAMLYRASFLSDHSQLASLPDLQDGLRRAQALGLQALAFDFAQPTSQLLASHGRFPEAVALIDSFEAWVDAQGDLSQQGRLQRMLASAHTHGDQLVQAIAHGRRAIALFRAAGDDLRSLPTMSNLGLALHWRSDLQAARAVLEEAVTLRDRLHGGLSRKVLDVNLAAVLRDLGEFVLADERLCQVGDELRATLTNSPDEPATDLAIAENHHAQLWLMLGQPERALAHLRADDAAIDTRFRARRLALRLRAARALGTDTGDLDVEAAALVAAIGSPFHRALFELEALRSAAPAEALAGFARLHDEAAVIERPALRLQAALRAAEAALAAGSAATAKAWVDGARASLEALPPYDLDADAAWRIVHRVAAANGDAEAAAAATARADAVVARTAAALPAAWRDPYFRRAGAR